jgi:hypothetical protein
MSGKTCRLLGKMWFYYAEISHSASGIPILAKGFEYRSFSDNNTFAELLLLLHCCFSTRLLTSLVYFMFQCRRLANGPRQFFQTYGFIARNTSEKDEESAAAQASAAAAAAATAELAEAAEAACSCKLEQTSLQSWLKSLH